MVTAKTGLPFNKIQHGRPSICIDGETMSLFTACKKWGVCCNSVEHRVKKVGETLAQALEHFGVAVNQDGGMWIVAEGSLVPPKPIGGSARELIRKRVDEVYSMLDALGFGIANEIFDKLDEIQEAVTD